MFSCNNKAVGYTCIQYYTKKIASVCNYHITVNDLHVKIIIWSLRPLKVQSYHGTLVYVLVLVSSNVCILQVNSSCLKRCRQYAQLVLLNNIAMLSLGKAGSVFQLIRLTNKHNTAINGIRRQLERHRNDRRNEIHTTLLCHHQECYSCTTIYG